MTVLGVLHPGQMGVSLAEAARGRAGRVLWAAEGRSPQTHDRAETAGLEDAGALARLAGQADVILSVCPPHAAEDQARAVAETGFAGLYCDANAISPALTRAIGAIVEAGGAGFVDGGIVGPPARRPDQTRLYLSGERAGEVAALFEGSLAEPVVLEGGIGAASALKMCYAGWTKGRTALLLAIRALARAEDVDGPLMTEWGRSQPGLQDDAEATGSRVSAKAWRWEGEMEEIAASFAEAGLPDGFHQSAARLYAAMAGFKDAQSPPDFADVIAAILESRAGRAS